LCNPANKQRNKVKTIGVTNKKDNEIVYHLHSLGRLLCSRITPSECAMCRYAEHGVIMTRIRPHPGLEIQIINRSFPNANHAHAELREFLIEVIHTHTAGRRAGNIAPVIQR